jgi:ankyrin repeat protein
MAHESGDARHTCRYEGATALYIASNNGDLHTGKPSQSLPDDGCVEIVRLLLDAGSPVNQACCIGRPTAIGLERVFGAVPLADPASNPLGYVVRPPGRGMSPLFVAAAKGNLKVVMLLIEAGAAVDQAASDEKVDGVGIVTAGQTRCADELCIEREFAEFIYIVYIGVG